MPGLLDTRLMLPRPGRGLLQPVVSPVWERGINQIVGPESGGTRAYSGGGYRGGVEDARAMRQSIEDDVNMTFEPRPGIAPPPHPIINDFAQYLRARYGSAYVKTSQFNDALKDYIKINPDAASVLKPIDTTKPYQGGSSGAD